MDPGKGLPGNVKGRTAVSVYAFYVGPHHGKGSDDPVHGALLDGCVTGEVGGKILGCQDPGNEPGGGAAVAAVQSAGGSGKAAKPFAPDGDHTIPVLDLHAHTAEAGDGGKAVGALQEAVDLSGPPGNGAQHDAAVGNGFVAGDRNGAPDAFCGREFHGMPHFYLISV